MTQARRFPSVPDRPLQHLSALESTSCGDDAEIIAHVGASRMLLEIPLRISDFDALDLAERANCVKPPNVARSLSVILSR